MLAACSAPQLSPSPTLPDPPPPPGPTTTTIPVAVGVEQFRSCLLSNGLEVGPIPLDGVGRPRLELALAGVDFGERSNLIALDACSSHLSRGPLLLHDTPLISEGVVAGLERFSACVRRLGVGGFPDPVDGFAGVGSPFPEDKVPFHDPLLPGAVESCQSELDG